MTFFLSEEEVLALHVWMVEKTGGGSGIRDRGGLNAAINRVQTGYYDGIFEQAAAILQSIVMSHPFVDGNKRTGLYAASAMLLRNGHVVVFSAEDAESFIIDSVIQSHADVAEIAAWLEAHAQPINEIDV